MTAFSVVLPLCPMTKPEPELDSCRLQPLLFRGPLWWTETLMQWWGGGSESIQQILPGRKLSLASSLAALNLHSRQDPDEIWISLRDRSLYPKHKPDELEIHQGKTPHLFEACRCPLCP